jgi:hypothetical protein
MFPRQISADQAVELRKNRAQESRANAISYTMSNPIYYYPICYDATFDIERQKDLQYRIRYQDTISNDVCSISKA